MRAQACVRIRLLSERVCVCLCVCVPRDAMRSSYSMCRTRCTWRIYHKHALSFGLAGRFFGWFHGTVFFCCHDRTLNENMCLRQCPGHTGPLCNKHIAAIGGVYLAISELTWFSSAAKVGRFQQNYDNEIGAQYVLRTSCMKLGSSSSSHQAPPQMAGTKPHRRRFDFCHINIVRFTSKVVFNAPLRWARKLRLSGQLYCNDVHDIYSE